MLLSRTLLAGAGLMVGAVVSSAQGPPPRPRALSSLPIPAAELRKNFAAPPADFRSMPLWVWNDELEWPRLKEQLQQMKQQGMGGVFVHPRPGLMTEYLGKDWFRLFDLSIQEGKRLGMTVNIYDENSYPSGFAGGLVPSRAPDTVGEYVAAEFPASAERLPWTAPSTVAIFAVERSSDGAVVSAKRVMNRADFPAQATPLVMTLRRLDPALWTAGFAYVDLTNPETTRTFIDTTYEAYRQRFGAEFGKTVKWAFTDEPSLMARGPAPSTPLNYRILAEFKRRRGYDLAGSLPSLFWDVGDYRKVRFDYWQTMHDLLRENFFAPLFEWCDRHNLQFTGHWWEHAWPYPWIMPDDASFYAYQHVPGIDMLEGSLIRTKGADPHMLFTIKLVAGVAHQLGRRAFCEAYGVAGWDSTFEHYKRFGDFLLVHGVNFMDQHLAFATVRGARKRDHPQSFSDVAAWWPYYGLHGDHLGRTSYAVASGVARNRVLVFTPTTSGYLLPRVGSNTLGDAMRQDNGELIQFLADHQVDFDLADEYVTEWFGAQKGRQIAVGVAAYDLVVWPKNMVNVRRQTLPHLEKYLAAGGEIVALGEPAAHVDGRKDGAVTALRDRYRGQWHAVSSLPDLVAAVRRRVPARILFDREPLPSVGFLERYLDNGDRVVFLANTGLSAARAKARLAGGSLEEWDTVTGRIAPTAFATAGPGQIAFDLDLPPAGSRLYLVKASAGTPAAAPVAPTTRAAAAGEWKAQAESPNVLALDYCDLEVAGAQHRDLNTWRANWTVWREHGFERPLWDNAVQFRTRVFDQNRFPPGSGFEATFQFTLMDRGAVEGLELAIESPQLYKVTLNGQAVPFRDATRWLDPHLRRTPIGKLVQVGENRIVLSGRPFDVRMELENIFLLGNFAVEATEKGFRLAAPRPLRLGSWSKQGYPFYGGSVLYQTEIDAPAGTKTLKVALGAWEGSVAEILLDGKRAAVLGWQPWEAEMAATPGKHAVAVRVVSTPRNVFGPFHNPTKPRMRAWPAAWADFPERQPAGAAYDVIDYGLLQPATVTALP